MIVVVTHKKSARLNYIIKQLFVAQHQFGIKIIENTEEIDNLEVTPTGIFLYGDNRWIQEQRVKLQAAATTLSFPITEIIAEGLLESVGIFENYIKPTISLKTWKNAAKWEANLPEELPVIFSNESSLGFDAFSMCFWILTRYEEYGFAQKHPGSRFLSTDSIWLNANLPKDVKNAVLGWPLVDWIRWMLMDSLGITANEEKAHRKHTGKIIPTIDVDIALKFGGRSITRFLGSTVRDLLNLRPSFLERIRYLFTQKDPYCLNDTVITALSTNPNTQLFILCSNKNDKEHKQIALEKIFEGRILSEVKALSTLGIHPSIEKAPKKNDSAWLLELKSLKSLSQNPHIQHSRFHYIHFQLPGHYKTLLKMGIKQDWSMGFPDEIGFRAGTCFPFQWYNLNAEKTEELTIHSFQIMDVTCKNYKNIKPELSNTYFLQLKQIIEVIGGNLCFVVHNESLSYSYPWKNWSATFENWFQHSFTIKQKGGQ